MSENGFKEKIVFRDYHIPPEQREVIEQWKKEVQEILDVLSQKPFQREKVKEMVYKDTSFKRDITPLLDKIENDEMNQEKLTVAAIGLWLLKRKAKWSVYASTIKPFIGGTFSPASFLEKGGHPNCIDTSEVARQMAEEFGVPGEVVSIGMSLNPKTLGAKRGHRFFQTDSGVISDVWFGRDRGGYFDDVVELIEKGKQTGSCV